jgi:hypothetical protein
LPGAVRFPRAIGLAAASFLIASGVFAAQPSQSCYTGLPLGPYVISASTPPKRNVTLEDIRRRSEFVFIGTVERGFDSPDGKNWSGAVRVDEVLFKHYTYKKAIAGDSMAACFAPHELGKYRMEPAAWTKGDQRIWFAGIFDDGKIGLQASLPLSQATSVAKAIKAARDRNPRLGKAILMYYAESVEGPLPKVGPRRLASFKGWPCEGEYFEDEVDASFFDDLSASEATAIVAFLKDREVRAAQGVGCRLITRPGDVPDVFRGLYLLQGVYGLNCVRPPAPPEAFPSKRLGPPKANP